MNPNPNIRWISQSSSTSNTNYDAAAVPALTSIEMEAIADRTIERYATKALKRNGKGVSIVWFRNDLRVLDNEALVKAWVSADIVLPVYCVDPRLFGTTYHFGFPKTGGTFSDCLCRNEFKNRKFFHFSAHFGVELFTTYIFVVVISYRGILEQGENKKLFNLLPISALRTQFLIECLADLKKNLMKKGLNLLIKHGKPEDIIPSLAKSFQAHTVYAQKETCSEEVNVEKSVSKGLRQVILQSSSTGPKLQFVWGTTMYHIDDLPFNTSSLPDIYTQFRKSVEAKCEVRACIKLPASLGPAPSVDDWGNLPSFDQFGLQPHEAGSLPTFLFKEDTLCVSKGMKFVGGESAALSRVHEYFWKKDLLKVYKETRNGMLGPDYSTKFSPWLASGSISPRYIYEEVMRYEKERVANDSTYWVLFELIWRDYFRFLSIKCGNSIFHLGGPRDVQLKWSQDQKLFESWRDGSTGYPLIDANMKELSMTGFMSNRGRQIVCSFLVRDMGLDWGMGAEWFETCLLDYDPCSNYGNWTYGAGVGNDPREDRYFSIPKQAKTYDPEGEYVAYWLPQLKRLPKEKRNFPDYLHYIRQVVPLKHGNAPRNFSQEKAAQSRRSNFGGKQTRSYRP
ncbi:hypothetical protein ACFE04_001846 [Oxalis oulophora]